MRVLRLLHVVPSIGPARGGPSFVVRVLARSQAELGLDVHLATTDDNGVGRIPRPLNLPLVEDGVKLWIFPRQTRFYNCSFPLTRWLWKHSGEFDVIHVHALFSYASLVGAILARRAGVPYILRPHGTLSTWGMKHRRPWLKNLSFRLIESSLLKHAEAVHYSTEQEAAEAEQWGQRHELLVAPNPVELYEDSRRIVPRSATFSGRTVVLFLSRIDPIKGLDLLLPAFARVRRNHPAAVLMIAGDGDPEFVASMRQQSTSLGLDDGILWTGFVAAEEKRAAFRDADLFVLPSYSENFGVAVVEAMAAGLPVIVSEGVGIHNMISEAQAGLVIKCSVDDLAAALDRALSDAGLRRRMGANGAELAKRFEPRAVALQLSRFYERIREKRRDQTAA